MANSKKRTGAQRIVVLGREETASSVDIQADETYLFYVDNWHPKTENYEKGEINWRVEIGDRLFKNDLHRNDVNSVRYTFCLPPKLCGSVRYTITAWTDRQGAENAASIFVRGVAAPLITDSYWTVRKDGMDVHVKNRKKGSPIPFGSKVKLSLQTEGLNGDYLKIQVYAKRSIVDNLLDLKFSSDDIPLYTCRAKCIDGEVFVQMSTAGWQNEIRKTNSCKDTELCYVMAFKNEELIEDNYKTPQQLHAVGLCFKNETIVEPDIELPDNVTSLKIGENDVYLTEYDHCSFSYAEIVEKPDDIPVTLFSKGRKYNAEIDLKRHFIKQIEVFFDLDKYNLRDDAMETLDTYATFWAKGNYSLRLHGHTDVRASVEHNKKLAYNRMKAVYDYLVNKGVKPTKIQGTGYNESQPKIKGENITEDQHQENRRVLIEFTVYENTTSPVLYQTVVSTKKNPRRVAVDIWGFTNKNCLREGDAAHPDYLELKLDYNTVLRKYPLRQKQDNTIEFDIYSPHFELSYSGFLGVLGIANGGLILHPKGVLSSVANTRIGIDDIIDTNFIEKTHHFGLDLHTCAYFPDKRLPSFVIRAIPDVRLVFHRTFDCDKGVFLDNIPVEMTTLIEKETAKEFETYIDNVAKALQILMGDEEYEDMADFIKKNISECTNLFKIGVHTQSDFENGQPATIIDYSRQHGLETKIALIQYYLLKMVAEMVLLWFIKGYTPFKNVRKEDKTYRLETEGDLGFNLITPKISEAMGAYYKKLENGNVARVYRYIISVKPLVGIDFEKTFNLKSEDIRRYLLKQSPNMLSWLVTTLNDMVVVDASMVISFKGEIHYEQEIELNLDDGVASYTSAHSTETKLIKSGSALRMVPESYIEAKVEIKVKASTEIDIKMGYFGIDELLKIETELKTKEVQGMLKASYIVVFDLSRPYYQYEIEFTGIKGEFFQRTQGKVNDKTAWDTNPEGEYIPFTLFKPFTFKLAPVYFLTT